MKKIVIFLISIISFGLKSQTPSPNQEWLVATSSIKFKIKNAGFSVDGKLDNLIAKINFDPTKSFANTIDASIDAKTIATGIASRDGHLKKKEYFNVDQFPKILMKATLFSKESDGSFKGYFKLTIRDKTRDVLVPFTFTEKDGKGVFKATFIINRLDYGVGESSMMLSNNATISLEVNVLKK